MESKRGRKEQQNRGSLTAFFDPQITHLLERPRTAHFDTGRSDSYGKNNIVAQLVSGQLRVNKRLVKEECTNEFQDRWFLLNQEQLLPGRSKKVDLFDMKPLPRPKTAIATVSRVTNASDFSTADVTRPLFNPFSHTARTLNRNMRPIAPDNAIDSYDVRLNSTSKTISIKNKGTDSSHIPPQNERALQKQVRALGTMVSTRKTLDRLRQERPTVISADYVLFMECLKKNIFPHAGGKLDFPGNFAHPHDHILADDKIVTLADMKLDNFLENDDNDSVSQNSQSTLSFQNNIVSIEHSAVIELNLSYRGLGPDRSICLSEALAYCPSLAKINLRCNRMGDYSTVCLLNAVFLHTTCTDLDLSENELGLLSINVICDNLLSADCQLQTLNINKCNLTEENVGIIGQSLLQNISLSTLAISSSNIGLQDSSISMIWCDVLQQNSALTALDLSHNYFKRNLAISFFSKLSGNTALQTLNLSGNQLTDLEACYCALYIENNATLTQLDLSSNMFSSKGCIALSFSAAQPTCGLKLLNLNSNIISDLAARYSLRCMNDVACYISEHKQDPRTLHIATQSTRKSDDDLNFNPFYFAGKYELDLANPFDRIVAKISLNEANRNPCAQIFYLKWLNPLFNNYEHINIIRESCETKKESLIEKIVNAFIMLAESNTSFDVNSSQLLKELKSKVGIQITAEMLLYLQSKVRLVNFDSDSTTVVDCYTLLLYWIYEFIAGKGKMLHIDQLVEFVDVIQFCDKSLVNDSNPSTDIIKLYSSRFLSELEVNDLDGTIHKEKFIYYWLEKSLQNFSIPSVNKGFINTATKSPYVIPSVGKLSVHISLPNVDGMENRTLSSYAFIVFTSSFASRSNQYIDYSYFLGRVLESKEKILSLTCEQAEIILMFLNKSNASHHQDYIEKLLYQMYSVCHRKRFLTRNLYFNEILQLRKKLGYQFNVLVGNPTGHYFLDLGDPSHQKTVHLLNAFHEYEKTKLNQSTSSLSFNGSQSGDKNYFRNASYNGKYVVINHDYVTQLPKVGRLRFDYVSTCIVASILPTKQFIADLDVLNRNTPTNQSAELELLYDIIFSPSYIKMMKSVLSKLKSQKNMNMFHTELAKKSLLQAFSKSNQDDEDDEEEYDDYLIEDDKDEGEVKLIAASTDSASGGSKIKAPNMMRMLSQTLSVPAVQSSLKANKKSVSTDRYHLMYVALCTDLWQDYVKTCYEKYKLAHKEFLTAQAEPVYREIMKEAGVPLSYSSDGQVVNYPAQVYSSPVFVATRRQPMYASINFNTQRRNAVVKATSNAPTNAIGTKRSSSFVSQKGSLKNSLNMIQHDPIGNAKEISKNCCVFEGMVLNLEIILLYMTKLESAQVKKVLEAFRLRNAPMYVIVRVVCLLRNSMIDSENLPKVVQAACGTKVHLECMHRLGAINYCGLSNYGAKVELDLATHEHAAIGSVILLQAKQELVKVSSVSYRESLLQEPSELDMLKFMGNSSQGLPKYGFLTVQFDCDFNDESICEEDENLKDNIQPSPWMLLSSLRPLLR